MLSLKPEALFCLCLLQSQYRTSVEQLEPRSWPNAGNGMWKMKDSLSYGRKLVSIRILTEVVNAEQPGCSWANTDHDELGLQLIQTVTGRMPTVPDTLEYCHTETEHSQVSLMHTELPLDQTSRLKSIPCWSNPLADPSGTAFSNDRYYGTYNSNDIQHLSPSVQATQKEYAQRGQWAEKTGSQVHY